MAVKGGNVSLVGQDTGSGYTKFKTIINHFYQ